MEKPVRGVLDLETDDGAAVRGAKRILRVEIDINVLADAGGFLGQRAIGLHGVPIVLLQRLQRQALANGPLLPIVHVGRVAEVGGDSHPKARAAIH